MEDTKKKFDYKWVIIFVSCLMVFTVLGFCSSANSMYIKPITDALDISRSSYSVTTSVRYVGTAVMNLFFGILVFRFGYKNMIVAGFSSLIISTFIYSIAETVLVFSIGSLFLGIGLSFTTTTMVGSVLNRWCEKNKGTVMGIALASNGVGAVLARLILTPIIQSGDPFGYRDAYRLVILILAFVALIIAVLFRNDPKGEEKKRVKKEKRASTALERAVLRKPYFFLSLICIFLTGLVLQSVTGIAEPHFDDTGVDLALITVVLSLNSLVLSTSKFLTGFIYDRAGVRVASGICYIAALTAMIALSMVNGSVFGTGCAFVYSVLSSVALPLETIMLPIFAREIYGEESFNKALGIAVSVNTAGYAVGGPIANLIFDVTGSYNLWIFISIGIIAAIFVLMNYVITVSRRDREGVSLEEKNFADSITK